MFTVRIPKKFGRFLIGKQKKKKSAGTSNFWNPYVNIIATSYVFVLKKNVFLKPKWNTFMNSRIHKTILGDF